MKKPRKPSKRQKKAIYGGRKLHARKFRKSKSLRGKFRRYDKKAKLKIRRKY